jgi:hypothetical protein
MTDTQKDKERWQLMKRGYVAVRALWLTPAQAAKARAWNDENKKAALGCATQEDE